MEDEEKFGIIGCASVIAAIAAVVGGVLLFSNLGDGERKRSPEGTPLTKVTAIKEKTVVPKAVSAGPSYGKAQTGDTPPEDAAPPPAMVAAVQNLGSVTNLPPMVPPPEQVVAALVSSEPLCYHGRLPRRVPSLFNRSDMAITFGADDYNSGNPLPRLEIFIDRSQRPPTASYLSLSDAPVKDFPAREVPVTYSEEEINRVIAKWIANVATEVCPKGTDPSKPPPAPVETPPLSPPPATAPPPVKTPAEQID